MLGRPSAAMTLDTCADPFDDDLDAASKTLDAARAIAVVGKARADAPDARPGERETPGSTGLPGVLSWRYRWDLNSNPGPFGAPIRV
jgi:hypothetical protein